jgi:hypothetical protein
MMIGITELMILISGGMSRLVITETTLMMGGPSLEIAGTMVDTKSEIKGVSVMVTSWMTGIRLSMRSPTTGMSSFRELNMVAASGSSAT